MENSNAETERQDGREDVAVANENTIQEQKKEPVFGKIVTIPNMISFFRIALIPFIIWLFIFRRNYVAAIVLVAVSAVSDIVDGFIARKFNMVSEFGKFIDPVADKLTQGALMICLAFSYPYMIALIAAFIIREAVMFILGAKVKLKTKRFSSAQWYGKLNTVIVEGSVIFLLVFGSVLSSEAALTVSTVLINVSIVSVFFSLFMYALFYKKLIAENEEKNSEAAAAEENAGSGPSDS